MSSSAHGWQRFLRSVVTFRRGRKLDPLGLIVGLILAVGVLLAFLDELGARLSTTGAFIAAVLTPLLTYIVKTNVQQHADEARKTSGPEPEHVGRNLGVVFVSAVLSLVVTLAILWAAPRVIHAVQDWKYHKYDTQILQPADITLQDNLNMRQGSIAAAVLPPTSHRHLRVGFRLVNNNVTTLCKDAALLKLTGGQKELAQFPARGEHDIYLGNTSQLQVHLTFAPETDPTCVLDLGIASASYYK